MRNGGPEVVAEHTVLLQPGERRRYVAVPVPEVNHSFASDPVQLDRAAEIPSDLAPSTLVCLMNSPVTGICHSSISVRDHRSVLISGPETAIHPLAPLSRILDTILAWYLILNASLCRFVVMTKMWS